MRTCGVWNVPERDGCVGMALLMHADRMKSKPTAGVTVSLNVSLRDFMVLDIEKALSIFQPRHVHPKLQYCCN